jgi:hypothetical protein
VNRPRHLLLGQENDLACVHGKMLDDVINGGDHGRLATLDGAATGEVRDGHIPQHLIGFGYCRIQVSYERLCRQSIPSGEFARPVPHNRSAADAADYPFPHVTREVHQEVADAV